jgi:hypothetical protein
VVLVKTASGNDQIKIMALWKFQAQCGCSRTTVFRWRQRGWLKTLMIANKPYVTGDAIQEFVDRAKGGEFARVFTKGKNEH